AARCDAAIDELIEVLAIDDRRRKRPAGDRRPTMRAALAAEIARTRSFLAALVDLRSEGSLYERLEPRLRFENTLAALKTLFLAESLRRPLVLHIEDAQWLDDDSLAALRELTRNVEDYPLAVLLTSRPNDDSSLPTWPVDPSVPQAALELRALDSADMRAVAE